VLPLSEVEEGHHGCFFILRGVAFEYLGHELLIYYVELEGNVRIVVWAVTMLVIPSIGHGEKLEATGYGRLGGLRLPRGGWWIYIGIVVVLRFGVLLP